MATSAVLLLAITATLVTWGWYRRADLDELVGRPLSTGQYSQARRALEVWHRVHADSADTAFYEAWLALAENDPKSAAEAIARSEKLGLDRDRMQLLTAIFSSRSGKYTSAEPLLRQAYAEGSEPRALVARELARIYLETFRLAEAEEPLKVWKSLAPDDAQPYMWSNEIALRSDTVPQVLIRNYRAALERAPNLANARLGLAQQLSKDRQFEEADREFRAYLQHKPTDPVALVGLGRNAFQAGDLENANRQFEAALAADPKNAEALKDLALNDMRAGQPRKACDRYQRLVELAPYDLEIRYAYAQALRLSGNPDRAKEQNDLAVQLRKDEDRIKQIRQELMKNPSDISVRFAAAQWMLEHGHAEEGLSWTKEILRIDPKHQPTHAMLVGYYQKRGDSGLANYHRLMATPEKP